LSKEGQFFHDIEVREPDGLRLRPKAFLSACLSRFPDFLPPVTMMTSLSKEELHGAF
jgi:hypothetical protein